MLLSFSPYPVRHPGADPGTGFDKYSFLRFHELAPRPEVESSIVGIELLPNPVESRSEFPDLTILDLLVGRSQFSSCSFLKKSK